MSQVLGGYIRLVGMIFPAKVSKYWKLTPTGTYHTEKHPPANDKKEFDFSPDITGENLPQTCYFVPLWRGGRGLVLKRQEGSHGSFQRIGTFSGNGDSHLLTQILSDMHTQMKVEALKKGLGVLQASFVSSWLSMHWSWPPMPHSRSFSVQEDRWLQTCSGLRCSSNSLLFIAGFATARQVNMGYGDIATQKATAEPSAYRVLV